MQSRAYFRAAPAPAARSRHAAATAVALTALIASTSAAADPTRSAAAIGATAHDRVEVSVEVSEPTYDPLQQLLDDEARTAMGKGDYLRAWHYFGRLLAIDPHDTRAMREAARVAGAMGKLRYAADTYARLDELDGTKPDPEVHFLRGEALLGLGKKAEAEAEFDRTVSELSAQPLDRQGTLWLARIAALRHDLAGALALYQPLLPANPYSSEYADIELSIVEAHILSGDWATAETRLRKFHDDQPDHQRGREMLAWVLGARGHVEEELALRVVLAQELDNQSHKVAEYGQALERHYDYEAALDQYEEARELGARDVDSSIEKLRLRVAPELGGGINLRGDGSGDVAGWEAGATVPLSAWVRLAVTGAQDLARGGIPRTEVTSTQASGWLIFGGTKGEVAAVAATVRESDAMGDQRSLGATGVMRSSPEKRVQLQLRGEVNSPWRESSSTIREGGSVDGVTGQLSYSPGSRRWLFVLAGQVRRLGLSTDSTMEDVHARQLLGAAGFDLTLSSRPTRTARGEMFDSEMLLPRGLADALVVSYRHYELTSDDPFGARLVLVERSGLDEISAVWRRTADRKGRLAGELRGGIGYDRGRDMQTWRAGASAMLSLDPHARLTLDYDFANESRTGLSGDRHATSAVLHVDL